MNNDEKIKEFDKIIKDQEATKQKLMNLEQINLLKEKENLINKNDKDIKSRIAALEKDKFNSYQETEKPKEVVNESPSVIGDIK